MSEEYQTAKRKRRTESSDSSYKRARYGAPAQIPTVEAEAPKAAGSKNLAARRLQGLREKIKASSNDRRPEAAINSPEKVNPSASTKNGSKDKKPNCLIEKIKNFYKRPGDRKKDTCNKNETYQTRPPATDILSTEKKSSVSEKSRKAYKKLPECKANTTRPLEKFTSIKYAVPQSASSSKCVNKSGSISQRLNYCPGSQAECSNSLSAGNNQTVFKVTPDYKHVDEDDEGTIIEIDDSPLHSEDSSFSLSRSFQVVSETPENKKTSSKSVNQRIVKIKRNFSFSNSNSKTLAPIKESKSESALPSINKKPSSASLQKNLGSTNVNNNTTITPPLSVDSSPEKVSPIFKSRMSKTSSPKANSGLANRLVKIKNKTSPKHSRDSFVENWIQSTQPQVCSSNESCSDSLMVNVDDTLFSKSELMTEPVEDNSMEWDSCSNNAAALPPMLFPSDKATIGIIIDTNVFMHDLDKVSELLEFQVSSGSTLHRLVIYVPFMVLQELDYIKDHSGLHQKSLALGGQKLINRLLSQSDPRLIGQSVNDVCEQLDVGKNPDDKILSCCLQAKTKFNSVILVSNDVNLRNKALTNDIKAYRIHDLLAKLKNSKELKVKEHLQKLLSQIITHCCEKAFGPASCKMDLLHDPPWPFEDCLKRLKRYWTSVFGDLLLKQCLKTIEQLLSITHGGQVRERNATEFKNKVKELLFYLQDISAFGDKVRRTRREVDAIFEERDNPLEFL